METINLLVFGVFGFISLVIALVLKKADRWKGLLFTSLGFYYLLFDYKILLLVSLAVFLYYAAFYVQKHPRSLLYVVLLFLAPLIAEKFINNNFHFNFNSPGSKAWINEFSWKEIFGLVGLSYFTFNGLSYVIDVKRKYIDPERNFFLLLLYMTWFPSLLSGPLHRYKYLKEQFTNASVSEQNIALGLRLVLWGLFKNMVIAQRLIYLVLTMAASELSGIYLVLTGLMFFLYLFVNFSSFIDIVQGISQLFNIRLKNNFHNRVYFSVSRTRFWKGWHITLNEWFRDYFFFTLARHDRKKKYTDLILLLTFLLIALWHGFTFSLLAWGLLNGSWVILERRSGLLRPANSPVIKFLGTVYHLFFAAILALVFISPDILQTAEKLFTGPAIFPAALLGNQEKNLFVLLSAFLVMDFHNARAGQLRIDAYLGSYPGVVRWLIYIKLILLIIFFGLSGSIANYYIRF